MVLWEVFVGTVVLKNRILANGEGQGADGLLTAWDATSGRIPILWTKTAAEEGIDDEEYKKHFGMVWGAVAQRPLATDVGGAVKRDGINEEL